MMQITRTRIKKINALYIVEGTVLENVESIKYIGVNSVSDSDLTRKTSLSKTHNLERTVEYNEALYLTSLFMRKRF